MIDNRKKCPELPAVRIYPDFPYINMHTCRELSGVCE